MYFDQIKAELVEAQDVLNKFVSDDDNIKLIEKAAKLEGRNMTMILVSK